MSLTSLVVLKEETCRPRRGQSKEEYEQLLVAHALGRATRKGVTDSNDATGKTKIVFLFSKHLGPRRFAETRVDGNRALKWDEIAQEKGPGELVRPQSTRTQCPSMRERRSHTQSTEFTRISRWPSRWLTNSKREHSTFVSTSQGSNMVVNTQVYRTIDGNKAVVLVGFVVDTLVIWTPRTANCPI